MMPPYQNYQAQQRQEQLNQVFNNTYNYIFVRDRNEAENWQIAPGNHLVFEDQNGGYFYTKSLGYAPNDKPVFSVFKRENYVVTEQKQEDNSLQLEVDSLKNSMNELKEMVNQLVTKPTYNKYDNKKGGNNK